VTPFRTEIEIPKYPSSLGYNSNSIFLGSCFSDNIGNRFVKYKFPAQVNPFGVLYNPLSIERAIDRLCNGKHYDETELFEHNSLYHSFDHYSKFSDGEISETLGKINASFTTAQKAMPKLNCAFITLGTSFVFEHLQLKRVVANCHKLPDSTFNRYQLKLAEIEQSLTKSIELLKSKSEHVEVVLTVSPIRHLKDGAVNNNWSKALLIAACHNIIDKIDGVHYFPAYEIMMDDLRDYRFYEKDMLHPNQQAIDYIWQKMLTAFVVEDTQKVMHEIQKVVLASQHRPMNVRSIVHQQFVMKQLDVVKQLQEKFPFVDLNNELEFFNEQIVA